VTKVLDIGSNGTSKTITITGTTHGTGHFTTDQNTFTNNNELITKQYADTQDATKLSLTGGAMTGHITTNQTVFSNNNELVTKQFVDTSIANLINSAPTTLDTLNELASALGNDPNFATTVTNNIATKLPLTGGSMTGHILTNQTVFSNSNELVTKQYVDAQIVASGGASQFTQLTDTPSSYTANRFLKSTGSGLDWFDLTSKTLTWDFYNALGDLPSASGNHGQIAHVHAEGAVYFAHNGSWVKIANNDVALGKSLSSGTYDLGAGSIAINQQDATSITITGCPRPLSAYNAGAGSGNYYTPAFLNERIIPEVVSATNQYVLGNDGTSATWLSTLQVGTTTMNIGTSTIKKFASWFSGTFLEYFMKATPSNGDTLGSVAFSDTSLNNYATFSGKVDDNSTRAGHFSFSTAFNNSIVEKLLIGKSDHSGSDAGQFKGVLKADGIKFSGNTTQTKPVEDPSTVGHVLTATAGGNWAWAAASGGGSSDSVSGTLPTTYDPNNPLKIWSDHTILRVGEPVTIYQSYNVLGTHQSNATYSYNYMKANTGYVKDTNGATMYNLYRSESIFTFDGPFENGGVMVIKLGSLTNKLEFKCIASTQNPDTNTNTINIYATWYPDDYGTIGTGTYQSGSPTLSDSTLTSRTSMIKLATLTHAGAGPHPNLDYTLDLNSSIIVKNSYGVTAPLSGNDLTDWNTKRPNYLYLVYAGQGRYSRYKLTIT